MSCSIHEGSDALVAERLTISSMTALTFASTLDKHETSWRHCWPTLHCSIARSISCLIEVPTPWRMAIHYSQGLSLVCFFTLLRFCIRDEHGCDRFKWFLFYFSKATILKCSCLILECSEGAASLDLIVALLIIWDLSKVRVCLLGVIGNVWSGDVVNGVAHDGVMVTQASVSNMFWKLTCNECSYVQVKR